jgi:hypothetical protein
MSNIDWRSKIEALLAKAESTGSVEEAEALREKAAFLSIKYGIEDATARYKTKQFAGAKHMEFKMFAPYAIRKCDLVVVVSHFLGCMPVRDAKLNSGAVWVFGFEEDLERVKVLYHNLLAQMHIELASTVVPIGQHGKSYRNSWMIGFVQGVRVRMTRAYRQAREESNPGTDLILQKSKEEVELAMHAKFPNIRAANASGPATSDDGYLAGKAVGERADIGQDRVTTSQNRRSLK